jgi:hypothetical protein
MMSRGDIILNGHVHAPTVRVDYTAYLIGRRQTTNPPVTSFSRCIYDDEEDQSHETPGYSIIGIDIQGNSIGDIKVWALQFDRNTRTWFHDENKKLYPLTVDLKEYSKLSGGQPQKEKEAGQAREYPPGWRIKPLDLESFYSPDVLYTARPFGREPLTLPFIMYLPFRRMLTRRDVTCKRLRESYTPPSDFTDFEIRKRQIHDLYTSWLQEGKIKSLWNESIASAKLIEWGKDWPGLNLVFRECSSYDSLVTDLNPDLLFESWKKTARELCKGNLCYAPEWKSASAIGLSCIVETHDGKIIVQVKLPTLTMAGKYASSSEGGMKYDDSNIFDGMIREIDEELHIRDTEISYLGLLAITRNLEWNARPEFHFLVKTRLDEEEIRQKEARDRWEYQDLRFIKRENPGEIVDIVYDKETRVFPKATYVAYLEHRYPKWMTVY